MTSSDRPYRNVNIRIDLASIRHNLQCVRKLAPKSKIMAVVKSDAYGHGIARVLSALADADAFAVATVEEAMALRHTGETKPVVVFQGYRTENHLSDCIAARLWPVIHDDYQLDMLTGKKSAGLSCWVKFDTGMGRVGFNTGNAASINRRLQQANVAVVGLMSHFASADTVDNISNDRQLREFQSIRWPDPVAGSMANSAATISRPDAQLDWVRPGLMLYGASPFGSVGSPSGGSARSLSQTDAGSLGLQPAMRVSTPVIAIRELKRGQRIGYGGRYQCDRPMKVAVIGAGYGDGYPRAVPDHASVMFGNQRCPLVGRISMDSMVVDISSLAVPPPIDYPVTLWGHGQLRVDEIAQKAGTIAYELLCGIRGQRQWIDAPTEVNVRKIDKDLSIN